MGRFVIPTLFSFPDQENHKLQPCEQHSTSFVQGTDVQWDLLYRFAGGPTRTARIAQALSGTDPTPSVRRCQCPFAPPAFRRPKPPPRCVLCSCCFPSPTPCLRQWQDTYHCQRGAAEPLPRCGGDLDQGAHRCLMPRHSQGLPLQINQPSATLLSRGIPCFQCFSMLL